MNMTDDYEPLTPAQTKSLFSFWDPNVAQHVARSWSKGINYTVPYQSNAYRPIPGHRGKYVHRIYHNDTKNFSIGISTLSANNEFVPLGADLVDPVSTPIRIQGGYGKIVSAYDPEVVNFAGRLWLAFEAGI